MSRLRLSYLAPGRFSNAARTRHPVSAGPISILSPIMLIDERRPRFRQLSGMLLTSRHRERKRPGFYDRASTTGLPRPGFRDRAMAIGSKRPRTS
jgi:hypothetical protein